jgi:positive regulator of sigma E activity
MTKAQYGGLIILLLFGFVYNVVVERSARAGKVPFMALFVILGTLVTLFVLYLNAPRAASREVWIALTIAHFAASGFGMALGSWQRR